MAPAVVATSQVTRFHTDTLETSSNEILLHGVTVSINDVDFISGAKLWLKAGTHYALVGRNGHGKSTLMKTIADGNLVGFPKGIRVMYVSQQFSVDERSPMDMLLDTDEERSIITPQVEGLELALSDPALQLQLLQSLVADAAEEVAIEHNRIAAHRSGRRGKQARTVALSSEHDAEHVKSASVSLDELVARANRILSGHYERLAEYNEAERTQLAENILKGLRFTSHMRQSPFSSLSGGWQVRVLLAQSLFAESDLLLLDEPTNHLDLPAILWLQSYIQQLSQTVVVVSHDKAFLDAIADETIYLKDKRLAYYAASYGDAENIKAEKHAMRLRQKEALEKQRKHIESSISSAVRKMKAGGDDKTMGMVMSRKKKLERLGPMRHENGKRYKFCQNIGRPQLLFERPEAPVWFKIEDPPPPRQHSNVLEVANVWHSYTGSEGPWVLQDVTLNLEWGSKIAIVGANGAGKSTLVEAITSTLTPTKGTVKTASAITVGYFSQQQVEDGFDDDTLTPVEFLSAASPSTPLPDIHARLGSSNLPGRVFHAPIRSLSGGERVKLALARALLQQPQLLVLDEPTNHLDVFSIEGLAEALQDFSGSLLLVSHDRWFVQQVVDCVYWLHDGTLHPLDDGVAELERKWSKGMKL
ncbi:hypothetical protein RI367_007270 [Sorochytrium milnesiophthora]